MFLLGPVKAGFEGLPLGLSMKISIWDRRGSGGLPRPEIRVLIPGVA